MRNKILGRLFMASVALWVAALWGSVDLLLLVWVNIAMAVGYFVFEFVKREIYASERLHGVN